MPEQYEDEELDIEGSEGEEVEEAPRTKTSTGKPAKKDETVSLARYNGLNSHATKLQKRIDTLTTQLKTLHEERESERTTLSHEATTWKTKATEHETAAQKAARERDELRLRVETGNLIRREFPGLFDLYDDGLMPGIETMEPEARTAHLKKLNERLGLVQAEGVKKDVQGSTPGAPNPGRSDSAADTPETAKAKVDAYLRSGGRYGTPEYNALQQAFMLAVQNSIQIK